MGVQQSSVHCPIRLTQITAQLTHLFPTSPFLSLITQLLETWFNSHIGPIQLAFEACMYARSLGMMWMASVDMNEWRIIYDMSGICSSAL